MNKTSKTRLAFSSVVAILLAIVLASIAPLTAFAAPNNDPASTSLKKEYYAALKSCMSVSGAWDSEGMGNGSAIMRMSDLKNKQWFMSGAFTQVITVGEELEEKITGRSVDGKIYCGENNNALVRQGLEVLGISDTDLSNLICGASSSKSIGKVEDSTIACETAYRDDSSRYIVSTNKLGAFDALVKKTAFNDTAPSGDLTDAEKYAKYRNFFVSQCTANDPNPSFTGGYQIMDYNASQKKLVLTGYSRKSGVQPTDDFKVMNDGSSITCQEMADLLKSGPLVDAYKQYIETAIQNGEDPVAPGDSQDDAGEGDGADATCYDGGGAFGWVLCPALNMVDGVFSVIYDNVLEGFMEFKASMLDVSDTNGVYTAWRIFQRIANLAFAIMILVVIISQVTGVGIDNYGIKRILPRLIIAAILINASYFVCQLAVDVSNIMGVGIRNIFSQMSETLGESSANVGGHVLQLTGGYVVTALLGGLIAAGAFLASGGLGVILPLLLSGLGLVFSAFFTFIILGVRQAAVVILVVVSPLAFAAYMLPNTKSVFRKWVKAGEGMLFLYPICSALIGGGDFASKVLLSVQSDSFFFQLAAMLTSVLPLLLVPKLTRDSMAAVGNVGAKISGVGDKWSGWGRKKLSGSRAWQDAAARSAAGIGRDGNVNTLGRWRHRAASGLADGLANSRLGRVPIIGRGVRGVGRGMGNLALHGIEQGTDDYIKRRARDRRAQKFSDPDYLKTFEAGLEAREYEDSIRNYVARLDSSEGVDINGVNINSSNSNDLDVLENALRFEANDGDEARAMALMQMLEKKGDAGKDRIGRIVNSGTMRGGAGNAIINKIVSDGSYKTHARTLHKVASEIQDQTEIDATTGQELRGVNTHYYSNSATAFTTAKSTEQTRLESTGMSTEDAAKEAEKFAQQTAGLVGTARHTGRVVGSMKASDIKDMTDDEFKALIALTPSAGSTAPLTSEQEKASDLADAVIQTSDFASLKTEQREQLVALAQAGGRHSGKTPGEVSEDANKIAQTNAATAVTGTVVGTHTATGREEVLQVHRDNSVTSASQGGAAVNTADYQFNPAPAPAPKRVISKTVVTHPITGNKDVLVDYDDGTTIRESDGAAVPDKSIYG